MPLMKCQYKGLPGWKWGDSGHCYTFPPGHDAAEANAKKKAIRQALAEGGGKPPEGGIHTA